MRLEALFSGYQSVCAYVHLCLCNGVLWRCWLGGRKGIRPVKKTEWWGAGWLSLWSKVQTCIWPSWCHCHSLSLASVKSRLVLPFWYWLTRVVPEKGPLNGCVCVCVMVCILACSLSKTSLRLYGSWPYFAGDWKSRSWLRVRVMVSEDCNAVVGRSDLSLRLIAVCLVIYRWYGNGIVWMCHAKSSPVCSWFAVVIGLHYIHIVYVSTVCSVLDLHELRPRCQYQVKSWSAAAGNWQEICRFHSGRCLY